MIPQHLHQIIMESHRSPCQWPSRSLLPANLVPATRMARFLRVRTSRRLPCLQTGRDETISTRLQLKLSRHWGTIFSLAQPRGS